MLEKLNPKKVFKYFEDICAIPHGSGNTKKISDYCVSFARDHGLVCIQDELNNVIIKKPASKGYEGRPAVILQGHIDMVCEKAPDRVIDFEKDGLTLGIDGDWIYAEGTTLGADNGIAVAMALAVLDDDTLAHPALEVLFTVDEETGMYGAEGIDCSSLSGKRFINMDTGEEGSLTAGCAGGARAQFSLPLEFSDCDLDAVTVTVDGLKGGHSGNEINAGRLNSNRVLADFLCTLQSLRIADIKGGLKDNVIPSFSECVISADGDISALASSFVQRVKVDTDPELCITVKPAGKISRAATEKDTRKAVEFLTTVPNGVQAMSADMEGLVETSLNLGILKLENEKLEISFAVRSCKDAEKENLLSKLSVFAKQYNADFSTKGHYPAWEYRKASPLREVMNSTFKTMYGKELNVYAVHAGLECGLFCGKIAGLDAVSMGPNMKDIHTCRERLSISSTARVYEYLCEVLKQL